MDRSTKTLAAARIDAALQKQADLAAQRSAATAQTVNVLHAELVAMGVAGKGGRALALTAAHVEGLVAATSVSIVNSLLPKGVTKLPEGDEPPLLPLAAHKQLLAGITEATLKEAREKLKAHEKRRKHERIEEMRHANTGEM